MPLATKCFIKTKTCTLATITSREKNKQRGKQSKKREKKRNNKKQEIMA